MLISTYHIIKDFTSDVQIFHLWRKLTPYLSNMATTVPERRHGQANTVV